MAFFFFFFPSHMFLFQKVEIKGRGKLVILLTFENKTRKLSHFCSHHIGWNLVT